MIRRSLVLLGLFIPFAGCSKKGPDVVTYPVTGVVTYKGKPVEGASVLLVPSKESARSAGGVTDAEGKFQVSTYLNPTTQPQGAMTGDYTVTVTKMSTPDIPKGLNPEQEMAALTKAPPPKPLLPAKYQLPASSTFKVKVADAAPEPLKIDLTD